MFLQKSFMSPQIESTVTLISPFPTESLNLVWNWLNQFPENNFDDFGPKNFGEFESEMIRRMSVEKTWGVRKDGVLCGIIAFLPLNYHVGTFHGICMSKAVHGTGTAKRAVRTVVDEIFQSGVMKISASYFATNSKVEHLLLSLGAQYEGTLLKQTVQNGQPIDMRLVAFFRNDA
jgi:RimJ/RimL family protein N-acetyltransferase